MMSKHPGPQPSPEISHYDCAGVNCTQKKAWRPLDGGLESSDLRRSSGSLFRVVCAEKQATQVCPTLLNKSSVRSTSRKRASTKSRCTLTEEKSAAVLDVRPPLRVSCAAPRRRKSSVPYLERAGSWLRSWDRRLEPLNSAGRKGAMGRGRGPWRSRRASTRSGTRARRPPSCRSAAPRTRRSPRPHRCPAPAGGDRSHGGKRIGAPAVRGRDGGAGEGGARW